MKTEHNFLGIGRRRIRLGVVLIAGGVAVATTALLAGFHTELYDVAPSEPGATASELITNEVVGIRTFAGAVDVSVQTDIVYGTQTDGALLTLDVCSPKVADASTPDAGASAAQKTARLPAVISVHGGSWVRGDKGDNDWRGVCTWLASEGFVAYSVNYRLVPDAVFPAAIDDLTLAVQWIRDNAKEFGIDPDRIGAFGGSAGGNLVALLGTRGSGSLTDGARVAAVAELSGPLDLTAAGLAQASNGLQRISLDYLGCTLLRDCPGAWDASAASQLDPSDPPFFIATSTDEFIPLSQSTGFAATLEQMGIDHELVTVPGALHSIGILDEGMRGRVAAFLHQNIGP